MGHWHAHQTPEETHSTQYTHQLGLRNKYIEQEKSDTIYDFVKPLHFVRFLKVTGLEHYTWLITQWSFSILHKWKQNCSFRASTNNRENAYAEDTNQETKTGHTIF